MSSTHAPSTPAPSVVVTNVHTRVPIAEFFVSIASGFALVILVFVQLIVRSRFRATRLATMRRRTRLDANYYLNEKWKDDPRQHIVLRSVSAFDKTITEPPQFNRVVPSIVASGSCARREARVMLDRTRNAMPPALANASMRTIAMHVRGALDTDDLMRFVAVFESVLFGIHRGDGTEGDVSEAELNFMRGYFTGPLAKELQLYLSN